MVELRHCPEFAAIGGTGRHSVGLRGPIIADKTPLMTPKVALFVSHL